MDKLKAELEKTPQTQDCTVSLKEVDTRIGILQSECLGIIAMPPPPPPKKEEAKPAEGEQKPAPEGQPAADAEMKDETAQQPAAEESKE